MSIDIKDRIVELRRVKASELRKNNKNWRKHPANQRRALEGILKRIGFAGAILARLDEQGNLIILDGHLRADVAGKTELPVLVTDLTQAEGDLLLATYDPISAMAQSDKGILQSLLDDVEGIYSGAMEEIGVFAGASKTAGLDAPPDIDRGEEMLGKWHTAAGQVWLIDGQGGRTHRLIVGDCRDADTVGRLFAGQMAQVAVTSPPYAMQRAEQYGGIPVAEYVAWWQAVQACTRAHLVDGGSFFVNIKAHAEDGERHLYVMDLAIAMKRTWNWMFVDEFCWKRANPPGRWKDRFRNGWEPVFQFANGKGGKFHPDAVGHWSDDVMVSSKVAGTVSAVSTGEYYNTSGATHGGLALPDNVIEVSGVESGVAHAAMFPVGLPQFFIKAFSDDNDIVYDPFMGSGTTMIAAEGVGRVAYGCEALPKYAAVLLERVSNAGMMPRLEADNGQGD